jgi:hypothetical protein
MKRTVTGEAMMTREIGLGVYGSEKLSFEENKEQRKQMDAEQRIRIHWKFNQGSIARGWRSAGEIDGDNICVRR